MLGAVPSSGEMITSPSKFPHHNTHPCTTAHAANPFFTLLHLRLQAEWSGAWWDGFPGPQWKHLVHLIFS